MALSAIGTNFPTAVQAYAAGGTVKLGAGSSTGSITSRSLDLSGSGGRFTVAFKVKGWTTITGPLRVTVAGQTINVTYTSNLTTGYESKSLSLSGGTANSTLKIETVGSRAFLDDVLVESAGVKFAGWLGGATPTPELLEKFAFGGRLMPGSEGEPLFHTLENDTLSLTATIRTSDPNMTITAETSPDLTQFWTTNGITSTTDGIDQTNTPAGNERRQFSVPTSQDSMRFLRLKATLTP